MVKKVLFPALFLGLVLLHAVRIDSVTAEDGQIYSQSVSKNQNGIESEKGSRSEDTQSIIPQTVMHALRSVVNIHGRKNIRDNTTTRRVNVLGAGVVVDERGYILTNYHVVKGVPRIEVSMPKRQRQVGRLVAHDVSSGLAVIKVDIAEPLPVVRSASSADLAAGEPVAAIGNNYGYENTVMRGIISAVNRTATVDGQEYIGLIQTDVSMTPGSTGGPLLNRGGQLVGINLAVRTDSNGIGFAVPSNQAMTIAQRLVEKATK